MGCWWEKKEESCMTGPEPSRASHYLRERSGYDGWTESALLLYGGGGAGPHHTATLWEGG